MTLQESLTKSRGGNPKIDTPQAACDLYYILLKRYDIDADSGIIQIRKVDHAHIEFRVKCVIFRFLYPPGREWGMFYRHMESDKWNDAKFILGHPDPVKHIVNLVSQYAFDYPPRPI